MSVKDSEQSSLAAVQVAVRIRPLSDKDRSQPRFAHATNDDVLQAHENNTVVISPPHNKIFTFDHVFGPQTQQAEIFAALGEKSIRKFVEGYNVTMLAYGQTSSGKTYTVGTAHHTGRYNPEQEGIVPRAMALLFDLLHQNDTRSISPTTSLSASSSIDGSTKGRLRPVSRISYSSFNNNNNNNSNNNNSSNNTKSKYKYSVKVSFVEIYNEELIDLLNFAPPNERPPVTIREDTKGQIYWTGVKEMNVTNTDDVLMYLQQGTQNRATGATDMNEQSSRSHAIFSVTLRQEKWTPSTTNNNNSHTPRTASPTSPRSKPRPLSAMNLRMNDSLSGNDEAGEWMITSSKLHFVDLAGSERLKRTAAEGDRRKEGININGGLLALGNVISALGGMSKKSTHIPYRDSKLTRLLQDSLGGSAMTLMIACVSPMEYNLSETLNTLQYANRARNIKNRMEKNELEEWLTTDNVDLLRATITKLKNELRNRSPPKGDGGRLSVSPIPRHMYGSDGDLSYQEQQQQHMELVTDLQRQLEELSKETIVTRERNHVVENELKRMKSLAGKNNNNKGGERRIMMGDANFEHSVEPVIEEYEKSMATLESQLSLARAAMTHSDIRIDELQALTQTQDDMVNDLNAKIDKYKEEERHSQGYIEELEGKLLHSVNNAAQDEEVLNELKNRIMKFKEVDDSTERYILDLENQLATNEAEYTNKLQQHQLTIAKQNETIEQLEHDLRDLQLGQPPQQQQQPNGDMAHFKERQALQQHIAKLEHDLMNVTTQLQQQQQNGLIISPALVEHDSAMEEQQQRQRLVMSPPPPSSTMDPDHEKRKRMFSGGNPRPTNNKNPLLQSTMASLDNVQSGIAALKERYKLFSMSNHTTLGDDDPHPQGLPPTMSTGSSLSSLDSIAAGPTPSTIKISTTPSSSTPAKGSTSMFINGDRTIVDIQTKCNDVVKQYQNQLQRIDNAIQRVTKLEQTTTASARSDLPISPTSPSPSPPPPATPESSDQRDALLVLDQQLKDRQLSLQEACTRFEIEMKGDLAALKQLYSLQHLSAPLPSTSTTSSSSSSTISSSSSSSFSPDHDQQKIRHLMDQIMQRLTNASQDVELQRSKTFVLQTKLQKFEVAFHARQQRKSSASEDQDGIEQLMKKMDAIKIQLESRDIKSISVKE